MSKAIQTYYPKILLFGEYSVILGSQALTMPYFEYEGCLNIPKDKNITDSAREIKIFFQYLKSSKSFEKYEDYFDWPRFQFDLNQGLSFDSNIPQGYGVGSSGAVTASIFNRYIDHNFKSSLSLNELQDCLAIMESHFHGRSSGLDPLVSLLNKPILYCHNEIKYCDLPESKEKGEFALFLLDTGRSRRTEALVNLFIEKMKNPLFSKYCEDELIPITHRCIDNFLNLNTDNLFDNFFQLSSFQMEHLSPMIPNVYHEKWQEGLRDKKTILKLCGAGGGGFLLGITKEFSEMAKLWRNEQVKVLWRL